MEDIKNLIKDKFFYYAKFVTDLVIEESVYNEYKQLSTTQRSFFKLLKLPKEEGEPQKNYQLTITIANILKEEEIPNIYSASQFFESKIKESVPIFTRTVFHYPTDGFETDPPLPVILEEKRGACGKIILNGIRITFPEYTEIDSVILDFQKCRQCNKEDIFVEILSQNISKFSFSYMKDVIKKAKDFSVAFVKERASKNE